MKETKTGYMEVDAWVNHKVYVEKNEDFTKLIEGLKANFKTYKEQPCKSFLWAMYSKDCKKNGHVCSRCFKRFGASRYQRLFCEDCLDHYILDTLDKPYDHYVYILYNDAEKPEAVYVGVTKNPQTRFVDHWQTKDFELMVLFEGFSDRKEAEAYETQLIWELKPPLNKKVLTPKV